MFKLPDIFAKIDADISPLKTSFSGAKSLSNDLAGGIESAFSSISSVITSPISAMLGAATAALSVGEAIHKISESMDEIDRLAKSADKIGISTEAFEALSLQAKLTGVDMGAVEMAVKEMQKALVEATTGTGDAAAALSNLHLNAAELANLPADQAIGKIGDALNAIKNPAERAREEMAIFGMRSGPELANLLHQGSAGIDKARDDMESFGGAMSRVDAAKVEEANDAITRIHTAISIVVDKIAVQLAPYISAISDKFLDAAKAGHGFGDQVTEAIEFVAKGVGFMADRINVAESNWDFFKMAALMAANEILESIDFVGGGLAKLANELPGVKVQWTNTFAEMSKSMDQQISEAADSAGKHLQKFYDGANSKAVSDFFADAAKKSQDAAQKIADSADDMKGAFTGMADGATEAQKKIGDSLDEMKGELATFGMSAGDKKLFDFEHMSGATFAQIGEFKNIVQQLNALDAGKKIDEAVGKFRDSIKSPADHLDDTVEELSTWLNDGKITMEEFDKGLKEAAKKADKAEHPGTGSDSSHEDHFVSLMRRGSSDALKLQFDNANRNNDTPKKQLEEAQRQSKILKDVYNRLDFQKK